MARKRIVSPEFFTHRGLYRAERKYKLPLRVAFAGLWGQSDRRGIFRWDADALQVAVLPFDRCEMVDVLAALSEAGFIAKYEVDGREYGFIPTFARWQTFHHKEIASKDPAPPQHWVDTVLARGQPGANPTVAVAVTVTDTDAVGSLDLRVESAGARADGGVGEVSPPPSAQELVNGVARAITTRGKRLPAPPPPGHHAALVGT